MPYPGRVLAIDYGSRRVGVAVSDPTRLIAQGVTTLRNDENLLEGMRHLIREHDAVRVVVGMPYAPDGGKGAKALEIERFIKELEKVAGVPVDTWDESYSSADARQVFVESGMRRRKRREKKRVDQMAARLMLQEYLDHHSDKRAPTD